MHKLSRIGQYRIFCVLNFREFGQNSRNSQKFLLLKYYYYHGPAMDVMIVVNNTCMEIAMGLTLQFRRD